MTHGGRKEKGEFYLASIWFRKTFSNSSDLTLSRMRYGRSRFAGLFRDDDSHRVGDLADADGGAVPCPELSFVFVRGVVIHDCRGEDGSVFDDDRPIMKSRLVIEDRFDKFGTKGVQQGPILYEIIQRRFLFDCDESANLVFAQPIDSGTNVFYEFFLYRTLSILF